MARRVLLSIAGAALLGQTDAAMMRVEEVSMAVMSKKDIMARMTNEEALHKVMQLPKIHESSDMVELLGTDLTNHLKSNGTAHMHRHHHKKAKDAPKGYAALSGARDMLNAMMSDAQAKLDVELATCGNYNDETLGELERMRMDVASYNAMAADARALVLKSQGSIAFTQRKLPEVELELEEHNKKCEDEQAALAEQIQIVKDDLNVTAGILDIIGDCSSTAQANLIQCGHCVKGKRGYMMIQNDVLQPLINRLKSSAAKAYVQNHLGQLFDQMSDEQEPQQLTQEAVRHQTRLMGRTTAFRKQMDAPDTSDPEFIASLGNESADNLNISEVPDVTAPIECAPNNKCVLGEGSCVKIRDRFLYVQAGIQDMLEKLQGDLKDSIDSCGKVRVEKKSHIADLNDQQRNAQTQLATSTKDQVSSESSSNTIAEEHSTLKAEYAKKMKECCDEQNDLKSEMCALEKIRGELYKMKGESVFITDCEVSDFKAGECSATCGGGFLTKTRSILVHPVNGMACPPLTEKESCNMQACPIDCVVGEWEGWSGCSAQCGGGVRERMRPVVTQMQYDGKPCEDTEETEGCNSHSCNADCILSDWSDWGACTQACWGGTKRREKSIVTPAAGTGTCPDATDEARLQFVNCNTHSCSSLYKNHYLTCNSKIDLTILMDGSGSLGWWGWYYSRKFVSNLIEHLDPSNVEVALQVFSGPTTWGEYERCIGVSADAPDMEKDCKITWTSRFTNKTDALADKVKKLAWPASTTLTSVALAEAQSQLVNGREDANSVVLVITDGMPLSQERTKTAAQKLMEQARVIWVPVGGSAPLSMIEELASLPKKENIIDINYTYKMGWAYFVNKVIAQSCPTLSR
mmetsp:Transcript_36328/g.78626  ORF Transcript_36328/g.78626 Transcript_36328/m.78626 type:complete len:861 (-) Transcript_36328:298-2880(-)